MFDNTESITEIIFENVPVSVLSITSSSTRNFRTRDDFFFFLELCSSDYVGEGTGRKETFIILHNNMSPCSVYSSKFLTIFAKGITGVITIFFFSGISNIFSFLCIAYFCKNCWKN